LRNVLKRLGLGRIVWRNDPSTEIEWDTPSFGYAGDVSIVGENIDTIKKNTEALLDASKEVDLEVNP
jgi:hypothetical protein